MQGKDFLYGCAQEIKDVLEDNFGSLDDFYSYVYKLSSDQYESFRITGNIDTSAMDRLKSFLVDKGLDAFDAESLVSEINGDYDELLAINYAQRLLGPGWKEKLALFDQMILD